MRPLARILPLFLCLTFTSTAFAAAVAWVDWTSVSATSGGNVVEGTLQVPGGTAVTVRYEGWLQSSAPNNGATVSGGAPNVWSPDGPYLSLAVSTAPPASDWIVPRYTSLNDWQHLSLSEPVEGLLLAVSGLNSYAIHFDHTFTILSSSDTGNPGQYGPGSLSRSGNALYGGYAHGVIRFSGSVRDLYWRASPFAQANGVTFGVSAVPLPPAIWLFAAPLVLLVSRRRLKS